MILFLVGASGVHIRCCLNPVEAGFLLFGFVWWLDCLLLVHLQHRNDSKDLLLLVAYAKKLQDTQRNIDEVCTLMQHTIPLDGLISAQDNRTLQSAKSCIQSLHVRVEALANVLEQTLISQQLQFMHMRAQHGPTSHSLRAILV